MASSTNPYLPKARATALRLLLLEQLPLSVVADRSGVHRTTIWRWKRKWSKLNEFRQLTNDNRRSRQPIYPEEESCDYAYARKSMNSWGITFVLRGNTHRDARHTALLFDTEMYERLIARRTLAPRIDSPHLERTSFIAAYSKRSSVRRRLLRNVI